jgi:hypothetical protein
MSPAGNSRVKQQEPELLKEDLNYEFIKVQQRNYKIINVMEKTINIKLRVWRQRGSQGEGCDFETYQLDGVSTDSSFWKCWTC